jgi:NAD(P)H-dependent flavin oxidoreductase YrpB (nitropropane dioxygenase family)
MDSDRINDGKTQKTPAMTLETALTWLHGIVHPALLAPMGTSAGGALAAAVTQASGLGAR